MTKYTYSELCDMFAGIRNAIDNEEVEGLDPIKGRMIRGHIQETLNIAEKPDEYYPARERASIILLISLALILTMETLSIYILNKLYDINVNYIIYLLGATMLLFLFVPTGDKLTEKVLRSDNLTLRKMFIPQKN